MKIQYTEFAPNPALRNTITHLPPHIAQNLIAQGVAVHVPYKNYVERLSEEFREGSSSYNVNPPQVSGVEWSCAELPTTGRPVIYRKSGYETARIEDEQQAIQYGCPEHVLKQFREVMGVVNVDVAEVRLQEQYRAAAKAANAPSDKGRTLATLFSRA